jgi:hypothetical protein
MPQERRPEGGRSEQEDLKRREYRDEKGEIHHHTKAYMERHGGEPRSFRSEDGEGQSAKGGAASAKAKARGGSGKAQGQSGKAQHTQPSRSSLTTTDHDEIRKWAEANGGKPAAVARTHSDQDVGIVRIMFPDAPNSEHAALTEISWDDFFKEFEDRKLALLYDPQSLFSKIIGRDTAEKRAHGDHKAAR